MKSRRERRKEIRKFKKKMPHMRGLDMNFRFLILSRIVNIARQDPKVWRIFSVLNREFAAVFNRASFSVAFPDVVFSDIVDHNFLKLKDPRMRICKCGKISKRIPTLYGDSDSVFVTTNMYGHTFNLQLQPVAENVEQVRITLPSENPPPPFADVARRQAFDRRQPQNFNKRR